MSSQNAPLQIENAVRRIADPSDLRVSKGAALAGVAAIVLGVWFAPLMLLPLAIMLGLMAMGFGGVSYFLQQHLMLGRSRPATLRVAPDGLWFDGVKVLERKDVKSGTVYEQGGTVYVSLIRRGLRPRFEVAVGGLEEGRRVLDQLGLGASKTTAHFRVRDSSMARLKRRIRVVYGAPVAYAGALISMAVLTHANMPTAAGLAMCSFILVALACSAQILPGAQVDVGADGVLVRWSRQQRFVPLDEIRSVEAVDDAPWLGNSPKKLVITRKSGESLDIVVGVARASVWGRDYTVFNEEIERRRAMILERIKEAMAVGDRGESAEVAVRIPDRGSLDVRAWMTQLAAVLRDGGYRDKARPAIEELWKMVEDPACDPRRRAAAATTLRSTLDEEGRKRLRVAAEATAAPRVRVALDAAAGDDDDKLAEALEEVSARGEQGAAV